jgi:hypothetical protein
MEAPSNAKRVILGAISGLVLTMCVVLLINSGQQAPRNSISPAPSTKLWDPDKKWTLEDALADAKTRVAEMAAPTTYPRLYTPAQAGPNEAFCQSNFDNKFCNHLHGSWGDAIPQTDEWCAWAILEFQDPSADVFNYAFGDADFTAFNTKFADVLVSATGMMAAEDNETGILAVASGYGLRGSTTNTDSPWPVSGVIWRMGNKFAKPWITESHRPSAQCQGLRWGFTLHGHWKAVKCTDVAPAMTAAGITTLPGSTEAQASDPTHYGRLFGGEFRQFWNAYTLVEDQFATLSSQEKCTKGPCLPDTDDPCPDRSDANYTQAT